MAFARELFENAVVVPSPATDRLCDAARTASTAVVIGLCEKESSSMGSMFNSQLFIDRDGSIVGVRRKIVPTLAERIVHSAGAGDSVRIFGTEFGAVSALMCGENSNPLMTFAMQALGARVHVASWPNFFDRFVDLQAIADVAGRSIAYQNACYVVNVLGAISDEMRERLAVNDEDRAYLAEAATRGGSAIYAPGGKAIAGPAAGGEELLFADADLGQIVGRKIVHDYAGDYNRFDIFQLTVKAAAAAPALRLGTSDGPGLATDALSPGPAGVEQLAPPPAPRRLPKRAGPRSIDDGGRVRSTGKGGTDA